MSCVKLNSYWRSLLNPMEQHTNTVVEQRNSRRFPTILILAIKQSEPVKLIKLKMVSVKFASNGIPYAFTTWMVYAF